MDDFFGNFYWEYFYIFRACLAILSDFKIIGNVSLLDFIISIAILGLVVPIIFTIPKLVSSFKNRW